MVERDDKINKPVLDESTEGEKKRYDLCKKQCHSDWQQDYRDEAYTPLDYYFERSVEKFCRIAHLKDDEYMDDDEKKNAMQK